jgi:penicillin-binding protein 2
MVSSSLRKLRQGSARTALPGRRQTAAPSGGRELHEVSDRGALFMTELAIVEADLSRFRAGCLASLAVPCAFQPCWRRGWCTCRSYKHEDLNDAGREQPHLGRADRAQPRVDPRPQRRGAGQQLLGLHAGDHAVQGREPRGDHPRWPRWSTVQPRDRKRFKRLRRSQELRVAADPHQAHRRGSGALHGAALRFPGVDIKARLFRSYPLRRGGQPPDRLHRPHQPGREESIEDWSDDEGQLPRHRLHRQAGRRAELRAAAARQTGFEQVETSRRRARGAAPAQQPGRRRATP